MYRSSIILLFVLSLTCILPNYALTGSTIDLEMLYESTDKNLEENIIELEALERAYNFTSFIKLKTSNTSNNIKYYKPKKSLKNAINNNNALIPIRHLVCIYRE